LSLATPERHLVVHSWPKAETQNTCKSRFRIAACAPVSQAQPGHWADDRRLSTPVAAELPDASGCDEGAPDRVVFEELRSADPAEAFDSV
jgi:hypothetical protein